MCEAQISLRNMSKEELRELKREYSIRIKDYKECINNLKIQIRDLMNKIELIKEYERIK